MKTIVDIGAHNGDDTDYYLQKGFKVVSYEPNKDLCKLMKTRFNKYIKTGALQVHNKAVTSRNGETTFYLNLKKTDWSSTRFDTKATKTVYKKCTVETVTLASVVEQVDDLRYLKIDVEGGELDLLSTLQPTHTLPPYISVEVNWERESILEKLNGLGYQHFMLIRQGQDHLTPPPYPAKEGVYIDYKFTSNHSGVFGLELPGKWLNYPEFIKYKQEEFITWKKNSRTGPHPYGPGWFDIHAKL